MDENTWDELWSRDNFTQIIEVGPNEVVPDKIVVDVAWLKEVKAEGDRLRERALPICKMKDCDLYPEFGSLITCGFIHKGICFREAET